MKYGVVYTKFWKDPTLELENPDDKLLLLYFYTNSQINMSGIYNITKKTIASETNLKMKAVEKGMRRIKEIGRIKYDDTKKLIWVINCFKYKPKSPNIVKKVLDEILIENYSDFSSQFADKYANVMAQFIKEKDKEKGKKTRNKSQVPVDWREQLGLKKGG